MVPSFIRRLLDQFTPATPGRPSAGVGRISGPPTSANGASSMHLFWEVPPRPLVEVSVDLEVVVPPSVDMLYFWALQVNFVDGGADRGGAHIGLQYHPAYPGGGAVNWGGYHPGGGGELGGSVSELPSALDNVNTRSYGWEPGRVYGLRVFSPEPGRWRGTVTDSGSGVETVIRDLFVDASALVRPMVWSEVFAHCDHPSVTVRWSNLTAVDDRGGEIRTQSVRTNYQRHGDGGCANTTSFVDGVDGFGQRTATERLDPGGTILTLPA